MEQTVIVMLDVTKLRPMENYRKAMDEKKMAELTESVRTKGVIQPILARPDRTIADAHEIVFGQRRWIAAKRAGLATIPAMIRIVTDAEALELQVIENSQREDPNPMEEGLGFKKLLEMGKHTTDTLAAKLDKSVDYVLGRIKLVALPKEAQDKMLSGEIGIGHALQLTRLKNEGDMKRLLKAIIQDGMSVRQTEHEIRQNSRNMDDALFDTENCANCQSRTRNQAVLFPGAAKDKDQCLDKSCFYTKTMAYYNSYASAMKAQGILVLTTKQAVEVYTSGAKYATSRRLSLEKGDHSGETPKNRAQCLKCKEGRAFFFYEHRYYDGGKRIETGWLCLNKACLDKMNRQPTERSSSSAGASSKPVRNTAVHARAVRDRFLYAALPAKFQDSKSLQKRLIIFHLLGRLNRLHGTELGEDMLDATERMTALLASFAPGRDVEEVSEYGYGEDAYAVIATIPEKDLDDAITRVIMASLRHTDADVLLRMTPEAGISMEKHFKIDQAYLDSMTKGDLVKFAKTLGVKDLKLDAEMKKPAMIEELMKRDLTGKVPQDVAEECNIMGLDELCPKIKEKKGKKK